MNRIVPAACLALALAALPAAPAAGAAEAKFLLELKVAAPKVKLGERIHLTATLKTAYPRTVLAPELKIGTPSNLVLYARKDGKTWQIAKLFGRFDGGMFKGEPTGTAKEMRKGDVLTGTLDLLAVQVGSFEYWATYLGLDRAVSPEPLDSKKVAVTVEPGAGGETKVGAKIKTSKGVMTAELHPDKAYNTVLNFLTLAQDAFFNGREFHRIMKDFMVQTGDPKGNGTGGPGYYIPGEPSDLKHEKGVLSMANEGNPNTGGSQFFILTGTASHLNGLHSAFGKVTAGMDVLDALNNVPLQKSSSGEESSPVERPKLEGVEMVLLK